MKDDSLEQPSPLKVVPSCASNHIRLTDGELLPLISDLAKSGNQKEANHLSPDIEERAIEAIAELRALRAWKARLEIGKLEFALDQYDKAHSNHYKRECAMFDVETEARVLVERAKEKP